MCVCVGDDGGVVVLLFLLLRLVVCVCVVMCDVVVVVVVCVLWRVVTCGSVPAWVVECCCARQRACV